MRSAFKIPIYRIATFIFIGVFVFISSCKKVESNTFKIINNSGYDITELSFSGAMSGETIAIQNGAAHQIIDLSYRKRIRVTPKLICADIQQFDPGGATFTSVFQRACIPFSSRDVKHELNTLRITSTESGSDLIFEITLN